MKTLERTNYEHTYRANSTGYSSLYNKTVPYNQKTISQIKRDKNMNVYNNNLKSKNNFKTSY